MSTPDYRRLAEIIRQQNPAPKGSDDFSAALASLTAQRVADAYETLADEQDNQPQLVEVTTYGSKEREYADKVEAILQPGQYVWTVEAYAGHQSLGIFPLTHNHSGTTRVMLDRFEWCWIAGTLIIGAAITYILLTL